MLVQKLGVMSAFLGCIGIAFLLSLDSSDPTWASVLLLTVILFVIRLGTWAYEGEL